MIALLKTAKVSTIHRAYIMSKITDIKFKLIPESLKQFWVDWFNRLPSNEQTTFKNSIKKVKT